MKRPDRNQQKSIVEQWKRAAGSLDKIREHELASWNYDWKVVDALLEIGTRFGHSRNSSGLIEMQRVFTESRKR